MRAASLLALVAVPLCAAVLPVEMPDSLSAPVWDVCEAHAPADCPRHRCAECTRLDGKRLCFTPSTAAKLPSYVFRCAMPDVAAGYGAAEAAGDESATAAAKPGPKPAPWEVCEILKPKECKAQSDRCSLCTRMDGSQLCFEPDIAAKMPKFAFKCTKPKKVSNEPLLAQTQEPEAAEEDDKAKPKPWQVCEKLGPAACKAESDRCSLCTVLKGDQLCFDPFIAAKLPPGIFDCKGPKVEDPEPEPTEEENKGKGPPMLICEMLGPKACQKESKRCSLCTRVDGTRLCFAPDVAAGLSPWAFTCTGAKADADEPEPEPELLLAAGRRGGPLDKPDPSWTPCESFPAAKCGKHKGCVTCDMPSGPAMCFNEKIAAKLPPIFKCGKKEEEPAPVLAEASDSDLDKKKKPWYPCEALPPTQCAKRCSLCTLGDGTELCFNPTVAAKLPPPFFKCSKPRGEE